MSAYLPAIGICGYSGAGKTILIEAVLPRLAAMKLKVAVVKRDRHALELDRPGKDSDRLFKAGADVVLGGPGERFSHCHCTETAKLDDMLRLLAPCYDLIFVEGFKSTSVTEKIWLLRDGENEPPPGMEGIARVLPRDVNRPVELLRFLSAWLKQKWLQTPVYAGILIGGDSSRMGAPKHLICHKGQTWLERAVEILRPRARAVALLGKGEIPEGLHSLNVLPDVEGRQGPMAGMLSAMAWHPLASWLFIACDLPLISGEAVDWLLASRCPGVWATMPRLESAGVEPLLAHYDFRARTLLEASRSPVEIAASPKVACPAPPPDIAAAWTNVNTPADRERLARISLSHRDS